MQEGLKPTQDEDRDAREKPVPKKSADAYPCALMHPVQMPKPNDHVQYLVGVPGEQSSSNVRSDESTCALGPVELVALLRSRRTARKKPTRMLAESNEAHDATLGIPTRELSVYKVDVDD